MRVKKTKQEVGVAVMLSPLIDCVFLLLIFFLVTSMIKRYERQIPIRLAAPEASVSMVYDNPAFQMRIDEQGGVYARSGRDRHGSLQFSPMDDRLQTLTTLRQDEGAQVPIELIVDRQTPFQTVIRVLDELEVLGFERISSRINRDR